MMLEAPQERPSTTENLLDSCLKHRSTFQPRLSSFWYHAVDLSVPLQVTSYGDNYNHVCRERGQCVCLLPSFRFTSCLDLNGSDTGRERSIRGKEKKPTLFTIQGHWTRACMSPTHHLVHGQALKATEFMGNFSSCLRRGPWVENGEQRK